MTARSRWLQWLTLLAGSAVAVALFEAGSIPAALLIGPMIAAVVAGVSGATIRTSPLAFTAAQAVVGVLIAASIEIEVVGLLLDDWPLVLAIVVATLAASSLLGFAVSRWGSLPGTTAIWGSTPGAASAMVIMADAFGADARLVAFMQYSRVLVVSATAAIVASLAIGETGQSASVDWMPRIDPAAFGATIGVAVVGVLAARAVRLPAAAFMGPMILGVVLHAGFGLPLQLPEWLLAAAYALVGWSIGLRFTGPTLRHAARTLPIILASIVALILFCGALAAMLVAALDVDPLTAFLATSPGGMDAVAVIAAASTGVDLAFVMTVQMARFLVVLVFGGPLTRLLARHAPKRSSRPD